MPKWATILLIMILLPAPLAAAERTLILVYPNEINALHNAAAEIVRRAYANIGVVVDFKTFPAERALQLSNKGRADGELVRIEGIEKSYPNLIRVPVSHVTANQMAFARDSGLRLAGWDSLRAYRIVFHRGYKVAERNTEGMNRHLSKDVKTALTMVDRGRMDIAIANQFSGRKVIGETGLRNVHMIAPPLQSDPLFHYLHRKHADLVAPVTAELERMRAAGEFDAIKKQLGAK